MTGSQSISLSTPRTSGTSGGHLRRHRRAARGIRGATLLRVSALLGIVALVLAGCGERGNVGIFASIEREEKIEKSNLPENATAGSMVYDSSSDKYYVAMGRLFSRGESDSDWDEVDHPSGYDEGHTLDIVNVDGTIYAAFFKTDSTKSELFELNTGNDKWDKVWDPGKEISKLIVVNNGTDDELFAVTVDSNNDDYNLVVAPGGVGNGTEETVLSNETKIFDGVAYDDGGDVYYHFVSASQYWESGQITSSLSQGDLSESGAPPRKGDYGGITFVADAFNSGDDRLYVTTERGRISYSEDGGSNWTTENHDDDRRYTDPAYLDAADFPEFLDGNGGLVVGLDTRDQSSGGYYEMNSGLSASRPDGDNYDAADIADASIHSFFVDTDNNTLFALTNGSGLWRADYTDAEPEWKWE